MKLTNWNRRFLTSTRGQIITMLRRASRTVNEMAEKLELTDNAVRAHLSTLERDGLVEQVGVRRGFRKPNLAYQLTAEAEQLFPKAYGPLLQQLLNVLSEQNEPEAMDRILREVGRRLAGSPPEDGDGKDLEGRVRRAVEVLGDLGGLAEIEKRDGEFIISGFSCPLGDAVAEHPEVCRLAEALVSELIGVPVQEQCQREPIPRCCFRVVAAK